jgi:hypothetical protein
MLDVPFFQTFNADSLSGVIKKATTFSKRMVELGHRAGFAANLTMHCERRESLVLANGM